MISSIQNFSENEYLIIFLAFIYGHIITNFFSGWAFWIQNRRYITLDKDHFFLSLVLFLLIVDIWWVGYFRIGLIAKSFLYFILSILTPINLYLLTTTVFPRMKTKCDFNLAGYFRRKERLIYGILGLNFLLNIFVSPMLERGIDSRLESYFRLAAFVICILAVTFQKKWFKRALLTTGLLILIFHISICPRPDSSLISGFSFVSYLTIFTTFVYGCVTSVFLDGYSKLIHHFRDITFSKEHFAWSLVAFGLLLNIWYGSWVRESFISGSLTYYILSLCTPFALFILAGALFPIMRHATIDLNEYFLKNKKYIFSSFGLVLLTNFLVANLMEETSLLSAKNLFRIAALLLAGVSVYSGRKILHRAILVVGSSLLIIHAVYFS